MRIPALFLAALLAVPALAADGVPRPAIEIARPGEQCVAAPAVMRRTHMDLLRHQRDRTLRLGERGAAVSLNRCIACHADRDTGAVVGSERNFCEACHRYAAVSIDCFDCHPGAPRQARAELGGEPR